jgi:hypothetical protein
LQDLFFPFLANNQKEENLQFYFLNDTNILTFGFVTFIGLAYQEGKDIVFRFIIEYSCLRDFGLIGLFLYEDFLKMIFLACVET